MRVRVARHTDDLEAMVAFYRDRVGLPELGGFRDHDGYDGVFLDLPAPGAHLELTTGGEHAARTPHPEDLLVLYVEDPHALAARIGGPRVQPANPYWARTAIAFADPDGGVLVVAGRDPDPAVAIDWHAGPRDALAALFAEADDSPAAIAAYRDDGRVLVAHDGDGIAGHLQLVDGEEAGTLEVKSLAVRADRRGEGIGGRLVQRAIGVAGEEGRALLVATAAADTRVLAFYQRAGFRLLRVERDAFTPERGYPPADVDGIALRDRVWLSLDA